MIIITELLLAELDRETVGTRRTLERVPEGENDWRPHEKSSLNEKPVPALYGPSADEPGA